ncbi:30S ribosomal protein S18 [Elusimicrobiota bacterium]
MEYNSYNNNNDNNRFKRSRGPQLFTKRYCKICRSDQEIDYKDVDFLKQFVTPSGQLVPGLRSGNCAKHQRLITKAVKRARVLALLPFVR